MMSLYYNRESNKQKKSLGRKEGGRGMCVIVSLTSNNWS